MAEFTQDAIKALTFNYTATDSRGLTTADRPAFPPALRTADNPSPSGFGGITPDGITRLIEANTADLRGAS